MAYKKLRSCFSNPSLLFSIVEILIIVVLAVSWIFFKYPFKIGLYLTWEGAYRMSEGQLPFRDFGLPMGGFYWVIPAVFFKLFGPALLSLIKAQAFINILSGLAFRSILKSLSVAPAIRVSAVLLFCLSFSFKNFWPWYNHTVIVFGLIALAFLLRGFFASSLKKRYLLLAWAGVFTYVSFFTKQDGGGLVFFICLFLVLYTSWVDGRWSFLATYLLPFMVLTGATVLYFSQWDFHHWFNYGQLPHNARVDKNDIIDKFMTDSAWLRFYMVVIALQAFHRFKDWRSFVTDRYYMIFLLLTLGILCMAVIYQITSYTPEEGNIFFHAFAFVFIASNLADGLRINVRSLKVAVLLLTGVALWWSQSYWTRIKRLVISSNNVKTHITSPTGENVVNMHNAVMPRRDTNLVEMNEWIYTDLPTLKGIKVPPPSAEGIKRIMNMDLVKSGRDLKVLNMSELTMLAKEIPYKPEAGPALPLWYHLGVGMFNRDAETLEKRIRENYYDLVLFEDLPELNHFFPYRVQKVLKEHYQLVDSFLAPRSVTQGFIEVYVKKEVE